MFNIKTDKAKILVARIKGIETTVEGGLDACPVTVFTHRLGNKQTWWGIHLQSLEPGRWDTTDFHALSKQLGERFDGTPSFAHGYLDRVINTLHGLITGKKKPVIYGNNDRDFLQAHFRNGCQIDVCREIGGINSQVNYGGYEGIVTLLGATRYFFLYHRGVALYNYVSAEEAEGLIEEYLKLYFHDVLGDELISPTVITKHPRQKGRH